MSDNLLHTIHPQRPGRDIYVPPEGPPNVRPPQVYDAMGEAAIFAMLADFYRELEQSSIRGIFPRNMQRASEKSAAFYVGILGGPPLYHQRYGNPAMRARHMPFIIDEAGRLVWLNCFLKVLENGTAKYNFPAEALPQFREFLDGFSCWMVNASTAAEE